LDLSPAQAEPLQDLADIESRLGRWDSAIEYQKKAERLDPRSSFGIGWFYYLQHRYDVALTAIERSLSLTPTNLYLLGLKGQILVAMGDLAGARAAENAVPEGVDVTDFLVFFGSWPGEIWLQSEEHRDLLLTMDPSVFEDGRERWALALAYVYMSRGEPVKARLYAEEARTILAEKLRAAPEIVNLHAFMGVALAYLGRKDEAVREGERALALSPTISEDAILGVQTREDLALICALAGEQDRAIDLLEQVLRVPSKTSLGWLRLDPNYDSLRGNPRFQKLLAGS
jgi:tetratricopeptide (TPR) repeat protein